MEWFRMYSEFANDPKVQSISEAMQRRLVMLFCLRGSEALHTLSEDEIAFALRITDTELAETKALFIRKNFINQDWEIRQWDERQFVSDSSKNRVAKYREKRKSMGLSSNGYTKHSDTVMTRDGHACVYCGSKDKLCIDHAYPVDLGGNDDIENLVCACKSCNSGKAGRTPAQAGYSFLNKATEAAWLKWYSTNHVTVTVTPQIQNRTDTETEVKAYVASDAGNAMATSPDGVSAKPDCPHQEIIAIYHEVLPQCPQIRDWTPARATQLRARWNEDPRRQNLEYWRRFFEYVKGCDFLVGRSGKTPFFADLEWMTKSGNFTKIREEKYANRVER